MGLMYCVVVKALHAQLYACKVVKYFVLIQRAANRLWKNVFRETTLASLWFVYNVSLSIVEWCS
jgi:hypothetical protein